MRIYHYSSKPRKEILTIKLQRSDGGQDFNRLDEISFMIDKIPTEVISKSNWPEKHAYNSRYLYCHTVDLKNLENIHRWRIAESPLDVFLRNNFWSHQRYCKVIHNILKVLFKEKGSNLEALEKQILKYKGTYPSFFKDWTNSSSFTKTNAMYACGVPHLIVSTKRPIEVDKTQKVLIQ